MSEEYEQMNEEHEHRYKYNGVVYALGSRLPGSGACEVRYYDRYFCLVCLDCVYHRLFTRGSSYDAVLPGATPAPEGANLP